MRFYFGSFFAEKASLSLWKTTRISSSNLRPNREEASFIIIIITIIFIIIIIIVVVRDLRVIDNNKQERISRHFSDNCLQRRFFLLLTAHQHTSLFRRDFSNLA